MKVFRDERGQTLIITALCMTCFMGFMALAVDVGLLFSARRKLQNAADAAATAATLRYLYVYNGSNQAAAKSAAITAGTNAAQANVNGSTASISVNTNAASPSAHTGCAGSTCYFEAIVSQQNPTFFFSTFSALFKGQTAGPFTVSARAVAGTSQPMNNCIYLTAEHNASLTVQGNWTVNAANCGVYINSDSAAVEDDTGKAAKSGISATSIAIVGGAPNNVTIAPDSSPTIFKTLPLPIPFSGVPSPTIPGTCPAGGSLSGTVAAGCYSGSVNLGSATLNGLYIFTGDVNINGAIIGSNVTLAIMNGSLSIKPGNSTVNLTAPTSGTYSGMVIYQPRSNTHTLNLQAGHSTGTLTGFIYAPGAELSMQDHGGDLNIGGLIVNDIDNGPAVLNITGYTPSSSPLLVVSLVE